MSKRQAKEGASEEASVQEPKTKIKRRTKTMNKNARETLQWSIRAINKTVLVGEVVTALKEQCSDSSLAEFANTLCEANDLLKRLIEYHCDIFCQTPCGLQEREELTNLIPNAVVLLLQCISS